MLEVPYDPLESVSDVFTRAYGLAHGRWGNLSEFAIELVPGEAIARVHLTGHVMSYRWDVASGNVASFYRRLTVLAETNWGRDANFKVILRPDGYADIELLDKPSKS